jgi:hypothetical protein
MLPKLDRLNPSMLALIAVGSICNAIWMLASPVSWYRRIPAALADFGPANAHLIRDVACGFLVVGVGVLWAFHRPMHTLPLVGLATLFFGVHALIHVWDTASGVVDGRHWLIDLPLTYLPALGLVWSLRWLYRSPRSG